MVMPTHKGGGASGISVVMSTFLKFPEYMCSSDTPIHIKEFIVVVLCIRLWGPNWAGHRVAIYCDNDSVCDTCVYQKPKDLALQKLLREYLYWVCKFNFLHAPRVQEVTFRLEYLYVYIYICYHVLFLMCFFSSNLLLRPLSHLVQAPNSKSDRLKMLFFSPLLILYLLLVYMLQSKFFTNIISVAAADL